MINTRMTKEEVAHIAKLARIHLTKKELEQFTKELESILEYVGELQKVDTRSVEPTVHMQEATHALRDDRSEEIPMKTQQRFVDAAPVHDDAFVKVKAVFE